MSSTALRTLSAWNQPPSHYGFGLESLAPVILLDWRIYSHNKRGIESLYNLGNIDAISDEDIDEILSAITSVLKTIDGYLRVRGTESIFGRKIRAQKQTIAQALDSLKRGYAPGTMPTEQERLRLGSERLEETVGSR